MSGMGALFVLLNLVWGCAGNGTSATGDNTAGASASSSAGGALPIVPGALTLSAKVEQRPMTALPSNGRADALAVKNDLEAQAFILSDDGSLLVWPASPASGWSLDFGTQHVVLDENGAFTLQFPTDGTQNGLLRHPSETNLTVAITLDQIVAASSRGVALQFPFAFHGACGMNIEDSGCCDDGCPAPTPLPSDTIIAPAATDPASATKRSTPELVACTTCEARGVANDLTTSANCRPTLNSFNQPREIVNGRRGTYPTNALGPVTSPGPVKAGVTGCVTQDGYYGFRGVPEPVAYIGSTCDGYVKVGACPNENVYSDIEYDAKIKNSLFTVLDKVFGDDIHLSPALVPSKRLHCAQNHKRRNCAMVCVGDVSVDIPTDGVLVTKGESYTVSMKACENKAIVVHDNGNFGITKIIHKTQGGGVLSGPGLVNTASGDQEIHHYRPTNYSDTVANAYPTVYMPDEDIVYTPNPKASVGTEDVYKFLVDDKAVTITFIVNNDCGGFTPPTPSPTASPGPSPSPTPKKTLRVAISLDTQSALQIFTVDPNTLLPGKVASANSTLVTTGPGPNGLVLDPTGSFGYVPNSLGTTVSGFAIGSDGAFAPLAGSPYSSGSGPVYACFDATGTHLFVSNSTANNIRVFAISNGLLGASSTFATGTLPQQLVTAMGGKYLYAANAVDNDVSAWSIAADGSLTPLGSSPTAVGNFPRTAVVVGTRLYVVCQVAGKVYGFDINADGSLGALAGSPYPVGNSPYGIVADTTGNYIYVTNFVSNNVSAKVIGADGALSDVPGSPFAAGTGPGAVAIDPSNTVLYVANNTANSLTSFKIDPSSGALAPIGTTTTGSAPASVTFFSK
jgi:6-phosphogluconolactonase (cycloisomerase 2 family)